MAEDTPINMPVNNAGIDQAAQDNGAPGDVARDSGAATPVPAIAVSGTPAAVAAPQAQPSLINRVEQGGKHVLSEIFQTLAGGKKKEWQQTPNGPVATYRDLKPGEMARGILAAALTGLASGYDPANRGKGPAMSSAFSAGFRGEQEAKEKAATSAEQEAQQAFKNKGEAQDRLLAQHRDARDQQASLERSAEHVKLMAEQDQRIAKGDIDAKHDAFNWNAKQEEHIENLKNLGASPIQIGGEPVSFTNHDAAVNWVMQNKDLALRPGKFDTSYEQDPVTGNWSVWQKPADRNRPQWLGVLVNDKGDPILDKAGNKQADKQHPFYSMDGKAVIPADRMTPQEFYDRNEKTIDMRSKRLLQAATAQSLLEKAMDLKERQNKTKEMQIARDHLNATNGDLNATDKAGNLVLTQGDRDVLMHEMRNEHSYYGAILDSAVKEVQNMATDDPNRPKVQALADNARAMLGQEMYRQAMLEQSPNNIDVITQRLQQKLVDTKTGKVNLDEAKKEMGPDMPKAVVDKVIDKLKLQDKKPATSAPTALAAQGLQLKPMDLSDFAVGTPMGAPVIRIPGMDADQSQKTIDEINALKTPQDRSDYIGKLSSAPDVKQKLLKAANVAEKAPAVNKTKVMAPNGQLVYATDEQLPAALAAGGTIVPESGPRK